MHSNLKYYMQLGAWSNVVLLHDIQTDREYYKSGWPIIVSF